MHRYTTNPTSCTCCGLTVFQHQGRSYTPVNGYLLTGPLVGPDRNGEVQFRQAYVDHECLPADMDSHSRSTAAVVRALEQVMEENPPQWLQSDLQEAHGTARSLRENLQEATTRLGLTRQCPRCEAEIGAPCENLTERKRGNAVATKHCHEERTPPADTVEAAELMAMREQAITANGLLYEIQTALKDQNSLEQLLRLAQQL